MFSIVALDFKRIFRSKTTWGLLLLALAVMAFQTVKEAYSCSFSVNSFSISSSGFLSFLSSNAVGSSSGGDVVAWQASPLVRLFGSFWYLDYLALAVIVIFGGFFAQDIRSDYSLLRRCRGLSPRRLFIANVLTIVSVSFVFSAVGIAFLFAVCLAVNPQSVNLLMEGQMILEQVFFLPTLAAAHPVFYSALFVFLYTGVLTFLGLLGYFVARISGNVLVASLAPVGFILVFGALIASLLPWPFRAFNYDYLSFAKCDIFETSTAFEFVGTYFIWIAVFLVVGLVGPNIIALFRKVRRCQSR